jgi:hypothetical protein
MSATTKKAAFVAMVEALRALYDAEIERLTDKYRPRILAGEFSGWEPDVQYLRLADELSRTRGGAPRASCPSRLRARGRDPSPHVLFMQR